MIRSDKKFLPDSLYLIQPTLVATAPILSLYSTNQDVISIAFAVRPLLVAGSLAALLSGLLFWKIKSRAAAAVVSSAIMILFWVSEGILVLASWAIEHPFFAWASARVALPREVVALAVILGFLTTAILFRRSIYSFVTPIIFNVKNAIPIFGQVINVAVAVVIAMSLFPIIFPYGPASALPGSDERASWSQIAPAGSPPRRLPNIYLIILDAYGRDDELLEYFAMDTRLGHRLKELGFYVAENSKSNYSTTIHSIPSILNYNYIQGIFSNEQMNNLKASDLVALARENNIIKTLQAYGYEFASYSSKYYVTDCTGESYCIEGPPDFDLFGLGLNLNVFEISLISKTSLHRLGRYLPIASLYSIHRNRIVNTISSLPDHAASEVPTFVLAHIIAPHEPFVFGENGEDVSPIRLPFSFSRIFNEANSPREPGQVDPEYARRYRAQATYITKLVADAVENILRSSRVPPIIIVQGDHGPYGFSPSPRLPRFAILNAYYLPNGGARLLYPDITPVNSFRIIFNYYFGAQLELLPDESYQTDYQFSAPTLARAP